MGKDPQTIILQTATVNQISKLDDVSQTFSAVLYVQLRFPGGALDPALSAEGSVFPMEGGKPTFRPSATWYGEQLHLANSINGSVDRLDNRALKLGDDILLNLRMSASLFENLELDNFPFDSQELQFVLNLHCRANGPLPVDLQVAEDMVNLIQPEGFQIGNLWRIEMGGRLERDGAQSDDVGRVTATTHTWGAGDRSFPGFRVQVVVHRRPWYYVINIMGPMASFALLAALQWVHPREEAALRLDVTLAMALAGAAYKVAIATMIPPVAYLTLLDIYVVGCLFSIVLMAAEGALVSLPSVTAQTADRIDTVAMYTLIVLFGLIHAYFLWRVRAARLQRQSGAKYARKDRERRRRASVLPELRARVGLS